MRLVGMMPCRNEDWILGFSARVALKWLDVLVILNHASTDRTQEIIEELAAEFPDRVFSVPESGPNWDEMRHRQMLLEMARTFNATHLAIVDVDEILTGNLVGWIRTGIESLTKGWMLQLPGYNLRGSLDQYHANGIWGDRWFSLGFMNDPSLHWCGDHFHQRDPGGPVWRHNRSIHQGQGGIMHLWGSSERRLRAKHAAYKMIETLRWPNKSKRDIDQLYNLAFFPSAGPAYEQNWRFADIPATWWDPYRELLPHIHLDADPWQEEMCRTLHVEHGADCFAGLDLFGVCTEVKAEVL